MILYTIQVPRWRRAKALGIEFVDTTVKSGLSWLAPSWDIVMGVKSGKITPEEYTVQYTELMRKSYRENKALWLELCRKDTIAIACYCPAGNFCHRYLLVEFIKAICKAENIPFEFKGELV